MREKELRRRLLEIQEKLILKWLTVKELLQQIKELEKEHDKIALQLEDLLCQLDQQKQKERGGQEGGDLPT